MGNSYDAHKSEVEAARRANGEFGSYESGESGATLTAAPSLSEESESDLYNRLHYKGDELDDEEFWEIAETLNDKVAQRVAS